jgi:NAD(P)-dependent dehydrogenase (short-subunit alcohol dehydrogenase family)
MSIANLFDLGGKRAVVTGGNSGIGEAMARALGFAGAKVLLLARRQRELDAAVARLSSDGIAASAVVADLADPSRVCEAARRAEAILDWSRFGVTCNAIGPGFFPTALTAAMFENPELAQRNAAQTCIGRNGELADLHGVTVFLASNASSYITGQTLMVDGGFTAR